MESNINKKTIYLEFYGLPGSGKSTLSHELSCELRSQGKNVVEPTYFVDHSLNKIKRRLRKTLISIIYLCLHPIHFIYVCNLVFKNIRKITGELISHITNISFKLYAYEEISSDYIIFDEGIIQSMLSLSIFEKRADIKSNINNIINMFKDKIIIYIFVVTSPRESEERISIRSVHDSRIEKIISYDKRISCLSNLYDMCEQVTTYIDGFEIDGIQSINCSIIELIKIIELTEYKRKYF